MLIYKKKDGMICIFIHIPKNAGKYIRDLECANKTNKIIKIFWGIFDSVDLAHIPYILKDKYIKNIVPTDNVKYYTFTRNPYNRLISAYFYNNPNNTIEDFKLFVTNNLINMNFNLDFDSKIIHYYPQYLFVCDENLQLSNNVKIYKIENYLSNPKDYNLTEYYDEKILQIINGLYSIDFILFNYKIITEVK